MYLYRAMWGMKTIDYIGDKYKRTLHFIKYISITVGFALMGFMVYLLIKNIYIYVSFPEITKIIKAPPVAPLIPYFPKLYGMESFFPPFYFTYFIIALGIIAITHEFSHGIFMKLFNVKIKSTGFAFFGPFLGAFVEEDKNSFTKKSNLSQMSILSAGAFANILTALVFFLLLILFFYTSFCAGGYMFNTYTYSIIPANETTMINKTGLSNMSALNYNNKTYYLDGALASQLEKNMSYIVAYEETPALLNGIKGIIIQIDNKKISDREDMQEFMEKTEPNQTVNIKMLYQDNVKDYEITLAENPSNSSLGYVGVGFLNSKSSGIMAKIISLLNFKKPSTYYVPAFDGNFIYFIYYLLWWVALISALVGLFNMLPLGILDGGRFFYLFVFSITKSEKFSKIAFKIISTLILLVFLFLTLFWFYRLF